MWYEHQLCETQDHLAIGWPRISERPGLSSDWNKGTMSLAEPFRDDMVSRNMEKFENSATTFDLNKKRSSITQNQKIAQCIFFRGMTPGFQLWDLYAFQDSSNVLRLLFRLTIFENYCVREWQNAVLNSLQKNELSYSGNDRIRTVYGLLNKSITSMF